MLRVIILKIIQQHNIGGGAVTDLRAVADARQRRLHLNSGFDAETRRCCTSCASSCAFASTRTRRAEKLLMYTLPAQRPFTPKLLVLKLVLVVLYAVAIIYAVSNYRRS